MAGATTPRPRPPARLPHPPARPPPAPAAAAPRASVHRLPGRPPPPATPSRRAPATRTAPPAAERRVRPGDLRAGTIPAQDVAPVTVIPEAVRWRVVGQLIHQYGHSRSPRGLQPGRTGSPYPRVTGASVIRRGPTEVRHGGNSERIRETAKPHRSTPVRLRREIERAGVHDAIGASFGPCACDSLGCLIRDRTLPTRPCERCLLLRRSRSCGGGKWRSSAEVVSDRCLSDPGSGHSAAQPRVRRDMKRSSTSMISSSVRESACQSVLAPCSMNAEGRRVPWVSTYSAASRRQ